MSDRGIVVAMSKWDARGVSGVIEDNDQIAVDHYLLSNTLSENWCKLTYLPVTIRVYVGSAVPYPDPYPPNLYPHTRRVSKTLAQHYLLITNHSLLFLESSCN